MKKFKGTPGKWAIENEPYLNKRTHENDSAFEIKNNGTTVSQCYAYSFFGIKSIQEANYNALLISKAPEMLEMLEYLVKALKAVTSSATKPIIKRAENLIKEATEL